MSVYTPLHRILGDPPGPLTVDMVARAVENEVLETEDLDWKLKLPSSKDDHQKDEFAKDVAAMANTRGGVIIFGVDEKESKAFAIKSLADTSGSTEQLHSILGTRIAPMIAGLEMEIFEDDEATLLAVVVPQSAEAPHGVELRRENPRFPRFPFRNGPTTDFMPESSLANAYSRRFDRRQSDDVRLQELLEDIQARVSLNANMSWLIFASTPTTPAKGSAEYVRPLDTITTGQTLEGGKGNYLTETFMSAARSPKVGLRRVVLANEMNDRGHITADRAELLWQGGCLNAWTIRAAGDGFRGVDTSTTAAIDREVLRTYLRLSLAMSIAHALGVGASGSLLVTARLLPMMSQDESSSLPIILTGRQRIDPNLWFGPHPIAGSISRDDVLPVFGVGDLQALAANVGGAYDTLANELHIDLLSQFAVRPE